MTSLLAQHLSTLQSIPLDIAGWDPVFVDLRIPSAHHMVMESPYRDLWRELDEVEIMRRFVRAGDVVFDIGANIGLHSIVLSRFAGSSGRLHAFEPNAELLPALTHTIGQLGNASLHAVALSNKNAESSLFVPPDDSVASLADWTALSPKFKEDGPAHLVDCRERRLSDLIGSDELPQPDFMKCDVEGAELQVFQGACETLDRVNAPVILFEANECASRAFNLEVSAAKDFLSALVKPRYRFFEITAGGKLADLLEIKSSFLNILAVPRSKLRYWPELAELGSQRTLTRHSVSSAKI